MRSGATALAKGSAGMRRGGINSRKGRAGEYTPKQLSESRMALNPGCTIVDERTIIPGRSVSIT
jgi:hypothetical protein